ncbi:MAG: GNAT family N-acetyltransferase [Chitinophagaceae bacterium]|nr:GNAT family N-acetyltransferase [Chitinophagaceae bacterium]
MEIRNSTMDDIDEIFRLYKVATDLQREKKSVMWPVFSRDLIETEIHEKHQWKIIIDNHIACIWATTFTDPLIWEERNNDPAIYIHRIATNPAARGNNLVQLIVDWSRQYAKEKGKEYIRLDTVGRNEKLIQHYEKWGFTYLGLFKLKATDGLPAHYDNASVSLFEIDLGK